MADTYYFGFWSNWEADQTGFHVFHDEKGGYLACTSTSVDPVVPKGAYFVGAVKGPPIEHVAPPLEGFEREDYIHLSENWWVNIPPMRKKLKVKTFKLKKTQIDMEI